MKKIIPVFLLLVLFFPGLSNSEETTGVRIAVLPFEEFSVEKDTDLVKTIFIKLSKKLSINPYILTVDLKEVQSVLKEDESATLNQERLNEIAKLLNANFILFGSVTKIRDEISIDVQLFNNFAADDYYKTFAEGTDLHNIINEISLKIEQESMDRAELIPPSQRPKVTITSVDEIKDELGMFDLDSEIDKIITAEEKTDPLPDMKKEKEETGIKEEFIEDEKFVEDEEDDDEQQKTVTYEDDKEVDEDEDAADDEKETALKEKKKKKGAGIISLDQPVNIHADSLEYDNKENRVVFTGNVVARQGNIVMFADEMKVHYSDKGDKSGLKRIYALGNVKMIQEDMVATGRKVIFYNDQQKIVATGNPRVWQGDNVVHGKKITVYLKEERIVVEGNPDDRVSATIYPKTKKKK